MTWFRILPPSDETHVATWRWIIAGLVILLLVNGLSARGYLGIGTFAYASDVTRQGEKIDRILALQIASTLRQLRNEQCRLNGRGNSIIDSTIEEYQQQYREIAGERYPMPRCTDPPEEE